MEERVPSAASRTEYLPPPESPPYSPPSSPPIRHNSIVKALPALPPPPGSTFVIQTQRDQVFRVPPPENSQIVESYLKQNQEKKGPGNCLWVIIAIASIGILLGIFFGVIAAIYKPGIPEFKITKFRVIPTPPSHDKKQPKNGFEITLNVTNPNPRMDINYGGDRYGLLSFQRMKIADGKFEPFSQEAEKFSNLTINLKQSAKVELPSEMERSMNSTKSKMAESLGFKMFVTTRISSWAKTTSQKDIIVTCTFKVNTLAKDTRIVYQECSNEVE